MFRMSLSSVAVDDLREDSPPGSWSRYAPTHDDLRNGAALAGDGTRSVRAVEADVELLSRLQNGDEDAFVELVARFHGPMLRVARAMLPSPAVAEDVVQDTWMAVVRGIERFEGRSSLKTWLFRILANRARSAGTRERRDPLPAGPAVDPARFDDAGAWLYPVVPWEEQAEERLDAARWAPVVRSALDGLPPRQREVVTLRDVEGLSSDEVCDVLGLSRGNQRILLHRGRSRLREVLVTAMGKG
jgi:RNA polymerase sigma-70 factor, ECF subfamily